jgi:ribosomal protein L11 methyltransferase
MLAVPAADAAAFAAVVENFCPAVSCFGEEADAEWRVEGFCLGEPDRERLVAALAVAAASLGVAAPAPQIAVVPGRDWLADNLRAFPPLTVGRYWVHGSHETAPPPPAAVPILMDAGTAFGSGQHGSTRGCLLALDGLARRRFRRPLDLGCGSGILAIAIAKTWTVPVTAVDVDPAAAELAAHNARRNGVGRLVRTGVGDGFKAPLARAAAPFDLVTANILARPLVRFAPALAAALAPGGVAVLAGFLPDDGSWLLTAHRAQGLALRRRIVADGWLTLVLQRLRRTPGG